MLIDTHCHLDFPDFNTPSDELKRVIENAHHAKVEKLITIATDLNSSRRCVEIAEQFPSVYATVGIHPCDANDSVLEDLQEIEQLLSHPKVLAIGECGLDHHKLKERNPETDIGSLKSKQIDIFQAQLELACSHQKNMIIHQRDSWEPVLKQIKRYTGKFRGVFHCFGGTLQQAQEVIDLGHLVSFTGIVTFKKAVDCQNTAAQVPANKYMLETDSPFLAPVPYRGKRCEPAYTALIAQKIADLRQITIEEVIQQTFQTAKSFFKPIGQPLTASHHR
ncbi:MAG: TatD family hydrolase [Verrucomicrobiota bacterium]